MNYGEDFALKTFGKRFRDFSKAEKREYLRLKKQQSRRNNPEIIEREKLYYEKNKKHISELQKQYREKNKEALQMYQKKYKTKPDAWHNTLAYKEFGKMHKDLTPEEEKLYNHIKYKRRIERKQTVN